jgi:hypothetical protein
LAHLVRSGWYREVRVKSSEAMLVKAVLGARWQLVGMTADLSNQIRGITKTFGLVVPKGSGGLFEKNVRMLLDGIGRPRQPIGWSRASSPRAARWGIWSGCSLLRSKTYGPPRRQAASADDLTGLRQRIRSRGSHLGQDGVPRTLALIKTTASRAIF